MMRQMLTLALISILGFFNLTAGTGSELAKEITVETVSKSFSRGNQTGVKINIYQATKKDVTNDWIKLMKKDTKSKVEEMDAEVFIIGANIPEISASPLNVYALINDYIDHIELNVFFESPYGFITQQKAETEFLSCRKFVRDFGVACYRDAVKQEIKKEEKKLEKFNGELKEIVNTNDKLHKNIAKEERDIIEAKDEIKTNVFDQDRVRKQAAEAKDRLYQIRGDEARKIAEKEIKDLEKDLSSLQKRNENLHKEIVNSEADIRSYKRSIDDNNLLVDRKEQEIDDQSDWIYKVGQKLLAIR